METLLIIAFAASFAGFVFCGVLLYKILTSNKSRKKHLAH